MKFAEGIGYQDSHEWAKQEGDLVLVGISDYAQDSLGDIVFVEFPAVGRKLKKGEAFGVVESVKAASDIFSPITGEVVEVNKALSDNPELLNEDPFGKGWIIKVKPEAAGELGSLLDAAAYKTYVEG